MSRSIARRRFASGFGPARAAERGIVLIVALIVLVVMTLAGVAMMRQSTSGLSIAGNIALRQNALSAADFGTNAAADWLNAQIALDGTYPLTDHPADGYYATWGAYTDGDPTKVDWTAGTTAQEAVTAAANATGNEVMFRINRLCAVTGAVGAIGQLCSDYQSSDTGSRGGGGANYPGGTITASHPIYRISARVRGPKNTTSFTQVLSQ